MDRKIPFIPKTAERHIIENKVKLQEFEKQHEDGVLFVAEKALPPWRRTIKKNLERNLGVVQDYRGFRVRKVNGIDEPGFPTHLR